MPKVCYAEHLVEYMLDISISDHGIDWNSINSWSECVGIDLTPWESTTIRKLASAYVIQYNKSKKLTCPPPYINRNSGRLAVSEKAAKVFR
jgi:hypothetical protein